MLGYRHGDDPAEAFGHVQAPRPELIGPAREQERPPAAPSADLAASSSSGIATSQPVMRLRREDWASDRNYPQCHQCKVSFTLLNRRHHCRSCGLVFCEKCSNHFVSMESRLHEDEAARAQPAVLRARVCETCAQLHGLHASADTAAHTQRFPETKEASGSSLRPAPADAQIGTLSSPLAGGHHPRHGVYRPCEARCRASSRAGACIAAHAVGLGHSCVSGRVAAQVKTTVAIMHAGAEAVRASGPQLIASRPRLLSLHSNITNTDEGLNGTLSLLPARPPDLASGRGASQRPRLRRQVLRRQRARLRRRLLSVRRRRQQPTP